MVLHVVLAHEDRTEHEYQDYGEGNGEEHSGLLAVDAHKFHEEICDDDAQVHSFPFPPTESTSNASPVIFRKTSSRLGFRTSSPRYNAPASLMALSIFSTSSVCSTLTLMSLWLLRTGSKPIFWTTPKTDSSPDCNVKTR